MKYAYSIFMSLFSLCLLAQSTHELSPLPQIGDFKSSAIVAPPGRMSVYGSIPLLQLRPQYFSSNCYNSGTSYETNVGIRVEIYDNNSNILQIVTTPTVDTLNPGENLPAQMVTTGWTPSSIGEYTIRFLAFSDSVNGIDYPYGLDDTLIFHVTDSIWDPSFGNEHNTWGTPDQCDDACSVGTLIDLMVDLAAYRLEIDLAPGTVPGGVIECGIYDTADFSFFNGLTGTPHWAAQATITAADVSQGKIVVPMKDSNGYPFELHASPAPAYMLMIHMYSQGGQYPIVLYNDAPFSKGNWYATVFSLMTSPTVYNWYSGYVNSSQYNQIQMRLIVNESVASLEDESLPQFTYFPNPTKDYVNLHSESGQPISRATILSIAGNEIRSIDHHAAEDMRIHVGDLPAGQYLLSIEIEGEVINKPLSISH